MIKSVRGIATPFVVACLVLVSMLWSGTASAESATPVATEQPLPVETPETPIPTEVTTPETEEFDAAEVVVNISIRFSVCGNAERSGTTDFFQIASSAIGTDCKQTDQVNGLPVAVTLTDVNGINGPYTTSLDPSGYVVLDSIVEEGSYTLSVSNGADFSAQDDTAWTLERYDYPTLSIVTYVDPLPDAPANVPGTSALQIEFNTCVDADRAGTVDVFITDIFATFDDCKFTYDGQSGFVLSGTTVEGDPFSRTGAGQAILQEVPYGIYTISDFVTGVESEPFTIDNYFFIITAISYYGEQPVALPVVDVAFTICEDDSRVGETEFILSSIVGMDEPSVTGSSTCVSVPEYSNSPLVTVTVEGEGTSISQDFNVNEYSMRFAPLAPGSYTVTESIGNTISDSFELVYGQTETVRIVTYVASTGTPEPGNGDTLVYIFGSLQFCTSPDRAGEVDFLAAKYEYTASASTSLCRSAEMEEGLITVYGYGSGTEPGSDPTSYRVYRFDEFGRFGVDTASATSGWFQFGMRSSALDEPVLSEMIWLGSDADEVSLEITILAYVDPVATTTLYLSPYVCTDPSRDGQTEFIVWRESLEATTTDAIPCQRTNDGAYTLTDTATMQTIEARPQIEGWYTYMFEGVPPGTYIISQERDGTVQTSEPVELAAVDVSYWIDIRNYTTDVLSEYPDNGETSPFISTYRCLDSTGERVYGLSFFANYGDPPSGDEDATGEFAASSTISCTDDLPSQYEFQLESVGTGDIVGAAVYPLPESTEYPGFYSLGGNDETIPTGAYILRDLKTGWSSSPITFVAEYNHIEFYGIASNGGAVGPGDGDGDTPGGEDPRPGDETPAGNNGDGKPVTQLPSTGQRAASTTSGWASIAWASLALVLMAAAMRLVRIRRY